MEYQLEGINQVQVNSDIGFNFAAGLRSIVRQDPDIIMIGEIRDTETANVTAGVLHETLTAAKLVLSFGRQKNAVQRYSEAVVKHSVVSIKFQTLQRGIALLFNPLGIMSALVAVYIAYLEKFPFSDMAMVLFALYRLMPIIGMLISGKTSIEGFTPAYEQIERLRKEAKDLEEPSGGSE